jgi:hypothetical protein
LKVLLFKSYCLPWQALQNMIEKGQIAEHPKVFDLAHRILATCSLLSAAAILKILHIEYVALVYCRLTLGMKFLH